MAKIRIIADDLGLNERVNEGILIALKSGWISGASLMPAGDAFFDAVKLIKESPQFDIGVHVVLVEETPLSKKEDITTLVGKNGFLHKDHRVFFIRYVLGLVDINDIEKESRLQIKRCLDSGVTPKFINSHQHLHLLPKVLDVFIKLAKEYDIPYIRIVNEPFGASGGIVRRVQSLVLRSFSHFAYSKIDRNGLKRNDLFVGFLNAGGITSGDINFAKELSYTRPTKIIEVGCHPGFENDELRERYKDWGNYGWERELKVLEESSDK
ncbi:MAG: ChbG/HpnK family deacetylase [Candidatus Pacebacteria bacterium]|nr:ChbG/HpnK family deacetylase [Candidatus Paceibacterota bacterium]